MYTNIRLAGLPRKGRIANVAHGRYTVNEVEERSKVPASTLRQWERRYGFPKPDRSESGYRLYSDEDIAHIESMKRHIANGIPASRAADLVRSQEETGGTPRPVASLKEDLVQALVDLDDGLADRVLSEAHALHPVEAVMLHVMRNAMIEIGDRWHAGAISTTTEHFASSYIQGRLRALLGLAGKNASGPTVIVACAPRDQHELGAMMAAVCLRREGYRVLYVGANTPLSDLRDMSGRVSADAVLISASTPDSVHALADQRAHLDDIAPVLAFGGMAFDARPQLAETFGGVYLSKNLEAAMGAFRSLVKQRQGVVT